MSKFSCINLECDNYNQVSEIPEYYVIIRGGDVVFLNKNKKQIICPVCSKPFIRLKDKEFEGFCTNVATFDSKSPQEKREILKKRANDAFNRNKEGMKEYRDFKEQEKP